MLKYVVVILDGAAGWPAPEHAWRTTLQIASIPNLDFMVRTGLLGLAQTVPEGFEPSSAAACTSILGYDPVANSIGRGAIEAASMGIELGPNEIALRCNLVSIVDGRMVSYAADHITSEESHAIVAELDAALGSDTLRLYPGVGYRHVLVCADHPELMQLAYTPPHDIPGREIAPYVPHGDGADFLLDLMKRARPLLASARVNRARAEAGHLPATDVWPFWPGVAPQTMVPFRDKRGLRAALTSGVDLLNGLAVLSGIDSLDIPGVTDGHDNDYGAQVNGALDALRDHDIVFIHIESPDEAGHAGDIEAKVAAVEAIDREVIGRLREHRDALRVLAMPDHPTPTALRTHARDAVPFVIAGPGVETNGGEGFDEVSAADCRLLLDPGFRVIDVLLA